MLKLSFVIPLYNASQFIGQCIQSIIDSELDICEYEVIVWDDGSTDNSVAVVEDLKAKYSNIVIYRDINHGVSYARNNAIRMAKGEYVWMVDADDQVVSAEVKKLMQLTSIYHPDMLPFCWKAFDGWNYSQGIHGVIDSSEPIKGRDLYVNQRLMMSPWAFLYRREFLIENNLEFDESYKTCEDIQFNQKALFLAKNVITSSIVSYIYRLQNNSASQGKTNAKKVLRDQVRRLYDELVFFVPQSDFLFLSVVFVRNIKDICFWIKRTV